MTASFVFAVTRLNDLNHMAMNRLMSTTPRGVMAKRNERYSTRLMSTIHRAVMNKRNERYSTRPDACSSASPFSSLEAASMQSSCFKLAKAILMNPGHPQAEPGMMHT